MVGGGTAASVVVVVGGSVAGGFVVGGLLEVGELPPPPHEDRATAKSTADVRFIDYLNGGRAVSVTRTDRIRDARNVSTL